MYYQDIFIVLYVQQGHIEEETATTHGKVDDIRKIWVYHPTSFYKVIHPELNVGK